MRYKLNLNGKPLLKIGRVLKTTRTGVVETLVALSGGQTSII
jgi:hypothetical protein